VEALLRWNRPGLGLVGPGEFIGLAEASGLIVPIGRWVLRQACSQGARWSLLAARPLQVNVNVSMCQLVEGDLIADVRDALDGSGLPAEQLTVEITESVLATDDDAVESELRVLRRLGVRISLDDFGTGFNSLGHLHRYPIDELKIDKSFVSRMGSGADPLPIVDAIMAMSRRLRLSAVAEGIETEEQRAQLLALGCDRGQGFRLAVPLTGGSLETRLSRVVDPGEVMGPGGRERGGLSRWTDAVPEDLRAGPAPRPRGIDGARRGSAPR
jgi:EAL domain-containing protein (putative c-di-GMP-specific phosphodiesterase class I)